MERSARRRCLAYTIGALVFFTAYVVMLLLCDAQIGAYELRRNLLYAAMVFVPYAGLFGFALAGSHLRMNKRCLVGSIFLTYVVQMLLCVLFSDNLGAPVFLSGAMNRDTLVVTIVMTLRVFLLVAFPFVHHMTMKIYAGGMYLFMCASFGYLFGSNEWTGCLLFLNVFAVLADLLFHAALFRFSDCLTDENRYGPYDSLRDGWILYGGLDDEDDWEEYEDDGNDQDDRKPVCEKRSLSEDYKRIRLYAAVDGDDAFVETERFFRRLANDLFWDKQGHYYEKQDYVHHLQVLRQTAQDINRSLGSYISDRFLDLLDNLLNNADTYTFRGDVMAVAHLLWEQPAMPWMTAIKSHEHYIFGDEEGREDGV